MDISIEFNLPIAKRIRSDDGRKEIIICRRPDNLYLVQCYVDDEYRYAPSLTDSLENAEKLAAEFLEKHKN
jgi:hypothetical protein